MQSVKSELEALSIPYMVKNEFASGAVGELPWQDSQPELWLLDESWLTKVNRIIAMVENNSMEAQGQAWQCGQCHEENGGAFAVCWNCASEPPQNE